MKQTIVASFTDAWIETFNPYKPYANAESHLLQMRGLKPTRHLGGGRTS